MLEIIVMNECNIYGINFIIKVWCFNVIFSDCNYNFINVKSNHMIEFWQYTVIMYTF